MSLSKRILFGNDPADDEARRELEAGMARAIAAHKFGVANALFGAGQILSGHGSGPA
jgi:hypothetical protein